MVTELERIARLEAKVEHMTETVDKMAGRVDEMYATLMKARGIQWTFYGLAGLIGFATSRIGEAASWLGVLPR